MEQQLKEIREKLISTAEAYAEQAADGCTPEVKKLVKKAFLNGFYVGMTAFAE